MLCDLSIHLFTWNVVGRDPAEDLRPALGLRDPDVDDDGSRPDLYAIGLQEVNTKPPSMLMSMLFEDPWSKGLRETLATFDYVRVKSIRLQGLLLLLFARRHHVPYLRGVQTEYTRTGLRRMWGNKGGVTIRVNAYGCSVCVINCHLAAHEHEVKQRIEDYNAILDSQMFSDPETENILCHDYIFWIGDLNFRITDFEPTEIKALVDRQDYDRLLKKDQLGAVMRSGEAFSEFREMKPEFKPSYKYLVGSDEYDLARRPSWTDRILYKVNPNVYENVTLEVDPKHYAVHHGYTQSDHKPVSARFTIKVFEEGVMDDRVEFIPITTWYTGHTFQCRYTIRAESTSWDWIGLFSANFSSLDDYVTYAWAAQKPDNEQHTSQFKVTFPDVSTGPGQYRLLYISNDFGSVLGMSEPFEIASND